MTSIAGERGFRDSPFASTWTLFGSLAAFRILLTWVYDTRIAPLDVLRSKAASAGLPPEIIAILAKPHVALVHAAMSVLLFAIGITFFACCLQGVLLASQRPVPIQQLFRPLLIASIASIAAPTMLAIQTFMGSGETNLSGFYATGSLAPVLLPGLAHNSDLYRLLSAVTVFEILWCVILAVQLCRIVERKKAIAAVGILWTLLTASKWALLTYVPRLLA